MAADTSAGAPTLAAESDTRIATNMSLRNGMDELSDVHSQNGITAALSLDLDQRFISRDKYVLSPERKTCARNR
jgi:hypothetical protein